MQVIVSKCIHTGTLMFIVTEETPCLRTTASIIALRSGLLAACAADPATSRAQIPVPSRPSRGAAPALRRLAEGRRPVWHELHRGDLGATGAAPTAAMPTRGRGSGVSRASRRARAGRAGEADRRVLHPLRRRGRDRHVWKDATLPGRHLDLQRAWG